MNTKQNDYVRGYIAGVHEGFRRARQLALMALTAGQADVSIAETMEPKPRSMSAKVYVLDEEVTP